MRSLFGFGVFAAAVAFAVTLYLIHRDGLSAEYFASEIFYFWGFGCMWIMAFHPRQRPRWGRLWIPKFIYQDYQARFVYASAQLKRLAVRDTIALCVVEAIGGIAFALYGFAVALIVGLILGIVVWRMLRARD